MAYLTPLPNTISYDPARVGFGRLNSSKQIDELSGSELIAAKSAFNDFVRAYVTPRFSITSSVTKEYYGIYEFVPPNWPCDSMYRQDLGDNPIRPQPEEESYVRKNKINNPNFRHRSLIDKEIIVSPYSAYSIKMLKLAGEHTTSETGWIQQFHPAAIPKVWAPDTVWCKHNGFPYYTVYWNNPPLLTVDCTRDTVTYLTPRQLGFNLTSADFRTAFDGLTPDEQLVSTTMASYTRGSIDALTILAELPKSAKSIVELLSYLKTGLKRFDVKKLALSRAHQARELTITSNKRSDLANVNHEFVLAVNRFPSHLTGIARERHINRLRVRLERDKRRIERRYTTASRQAKKELTSGVASAWMRVRYEVMPVLYSLEDYLDLKNKADAQFITERGKLGLSADLPQVPGWTSTITKCQVKHRVMFKGKVENASDRSFRLVYTNIFSTAWELVPYSWVVDWFVGVGDWVTNNMGLGITSANVVTYSFSTDYSVSYQHDTVNSAVHVSAKMYKRLILNPCDFTGLHLGSGMNLRRSIDAVALLWNVVKHR